MKGQIKIQVSDDGLFGTPVNPFNREFCESRQVSCLASDICECKNADDWVSSHPQLPLTTPQIPKSVVRGELVWREHVIADRHDIWRDCEIIGDEYVCRQGFEQKQFYKVITPVPNSEPKETLYKKPYRVGRKTKRALLDASGIEVCIFPIGCENYAQIICNIENGTYVAQQQPVSKSGCVYSREQVLKAMSKLRDVLFYASVEDQKQTQTNWKAINLEEYLPQPTMSL